MSWWRARPQAGGLLWTSKRYLARRRVFRPGKKIEKPDLLSKGRISVSRRMGGQANEVRSYMEPAEDRSPSHDYLHTVSAGLSASMAGGLDAAEKSRVVRLAPTHRTRPTSGATLFPHARMMD